MRSSVALAAVGLLLWASGLTGCAHGKSSGEVLRARAGDHLYERSVDELWPVVHEQLRRRGYRLRVDRKSYAMVSEWEERFAGSRVAGVWTRLLVLGEPLGPARCRLRAFWLQRTSAPTLQAASAEHSWAVRPDLGAGQPTFSAADPTRENPAASLEQWVEVANRADGDLRAQAVGASATRALDMEWELLELLDGEAAAQYLSGKTVVARAARPSPKPAAAQAKGPAAALPSAPKPIDCGEPIPGLFPTVAQGRVVLLGELPGTREVPRFVGDAACQAAAQALPVTVGLELPLAEQARVFRYMASDGGAEAAELLLEGPFWSRPHQDGRSSAAMLQLLERLRRLRQSGRDVLVFAYDAPELAGNAHEERIAEAIVREVHNHPGRFFLVVGGNVHNRLEEGEPWAEDLRPMGLRVLQAFGSAAVSSLDVAYASGTAWICSVQPKMECGVHPAKGNDHGPRPFVHLWGGEKAGYHGIYYVGQVSASPPAIGAARREEPGAATEPPAPEARLRP